MCNIYTGTPQDRYDSEARSIRIQGCVTSIRLEKCSLRRNSGYT